MISEEQCDATAYTSPNILISAEIAVYRMYELQCDSSNFVNIFVSTVNKLTQCLYCSRNALYSHTKA